MKIGEHWQVKLIKITVRNKLLIALQVLNTWSNQFDSAVCLDFISGVSLLSVFYIFVCFGINKFAMPA